MKVQSDFVTKFSIPFLFLLKKSHWALINRLKWFHEIVQFRKDDKVAVCRCLLRGLGVSVVVDYTEMLLPCPLNDPTRTLE